MANEKSILNGGFIEVPEHATFEDLMKKWPKEPLVRRDPPIGVSKDEYDWLESEYRKAFSEKRKKKNNEI